MTGIQIRERLRQGQRVYGTLIASLMNPTAAAMAAEMELDFAFFCTEHMPLDHTEIGQLCRFYAARGISPVVRVPRPDASAISLALDSGAEGIVVPYVETVEEVRLCAGALRYRPLKGELLRRALAGQYELPEKTRSFLEEFNRGRYLIIGIESLPAIENLEKLITAAEVDAVFLGPHDITVSMGIPTEYDNPAFVGLVEDVMRRCRRCGVSVGMHMPLLRLGPDVLRRLFAAGMNWVINNSDIVAMREAMNAELRALRQLAGPDVPAPAAADAARPEKPCIG